MQVPLREGDFNIGFPESPVDLLAQVALDTQVVPKIAYPDKQLEIEGAVTESLEQNQGFGIIQNVG
jgi:hypothetical protein